MKEEKGKTVDKGKIIGAAGDWETVIEAKEVKKKKTANVR